MTKLFYKNDFKSVGTAADPFVLYDDGWFYLYYTGGNHLTAYRTQNFSDWDFLGTVYKPEESSWIKRHMWAPEVIKWTDGLYYMYITAAGNSDAACPEGTTVDGKNGTMVCRPALDGVTTAVLTADKPYGPFRQWTGSRPNMATYRHGVQTGMGDTVALDTFPFFDFASCPAGWAVNAETYAQNGTNIFSVLDANPYVDSDGTLYMYFARSQNSNRVKSGVWGVRMIDPVTPDYSTMVKLTEPRQLYPDGPESYDGYMDGKLNEGPYIFRRDNKYYMTYSGGDGYNTGLAVGDSPLGRFEKLAPKHRNPLLRVSPEFGFYPSPEGWGVFGAGHGMVFRAGEEYFFASLTTRPLGDGSGKTHRTAMFDRMIWKYNAELGYELPVINGPTYGTLQAAPAVSTGCTDIAPFARVSATNSADGSSAELLTDGIIAIHKRDDGHTFFAKPGGTEITIEFDVPRLVCAVMVYNARTPEYAFSGIDEIILENGVNKTVLNNIEYPAEYVIGDPTAERIKDETQMQPAEYWAENPLTDGGLLPGGAAIAEFAETAVTKITIKITEKLVNNGQGIGISQINILEKENVES